MSLVIILISMALCVGCYALGYYDAKDKFEKSIPVQKFMYYQPDCIDINVSRKITPYDRHYLKTDEDIESFVHEALMHDLGKAVFQYAVLKKSFDNGSNSEVFNAIVSVFDRREE